MKASWIRWAAAVLMLFGLIFLLSAPSIAEESGTAVKKLSLDMKVPGKKPKKKGWFKRMLEGDDDEDEYEDDSDWSEDDEPVKKTKPEKKRHKLFEIVEVDDDEDDEDYDD